VRSPPPRPGITGTSGKPENEKSYTIKIESLILKRKRQEIQKRTLF
jgi:hypothetical protein